MRPYGRALRSVRDFDPSRERHESFEPLLPEVSAEAPSAYALMSHLPLT